MMNLDKKKIAIALFVLSLIGNAVLAGGYLLSRMDLIEARKAADKEKANRQIAGFASLFVEKVLKAEKEVNFEERLILETAVRDLNNEEILLQWRKFTESETKEDAQKEVKNLLELLLKKIST